MQITEYLDQNGVKYEICAHRAVFTAQQMAAEEHVPGRDVAKPVIVQADGTYYMCVLPACCKVDLELLRGALGAAEATLIGEKEMARLFPDCELGAEPPFGSLFDMPTLMDDTLGQDGYIVFQAGSHEKAVRLALKDYQKLAHPQVLHFSYHLH
ncbi:MAG: YbaK/EbsC family protein, partial [Sedimentisphaerales bacterium]|nr:YbaK/EbsC family protein [Sedimentisphaerales bacterium]